MRRLLEILLGLPPEIAERGLVYLPSPYGDQIGLIIHWGLYSIPAYDSVYSARQRTLQNGSEWYAERLSKTTSFPYPTSGSPQTQQFHKMRFPQIASYYDFQAHWKPGDGDRLQWLQYANEWARLVRRIGGSSLVLTAKHHDGFALWPTTIRPERSVLQTPCPWDLLADVKEACRQWGVKFGIYYSWGEFASGSTPPSTNACMKHITPLQIRELQERYQPDLFWWDGDWWCSSSTAFAAIMREEVLRCKSKNPSLELNERMGRSNLDLATFRVFRDRTVMSNFSGGKWEHVNTIGNSWGYNR